MRKGKKNTNQTPREGYVAKAVREYYSDLKDVKHDDSNLKVAICLGKRCYEHVIKSKKSGEINVQPYKLKCTTIPDLREALFDCFINICGTLKARLSGELFRRNAKFYTNSGFHNSPRKFQETKKLYSPTDG